jgi:superfamily II DNA or RNA helicase/HKD family nuclease
MPFASNNLAIAVRLRVARSSDRVSVVPRRRIASWSQATRDEQLAILDLVDVARSLLDAELAPLRYTVQFHDAVNNGVAGGLLGVDVIPHLEPPGADDADALAGAMPGTAAQLAPGRPRLVTPSKGRMRAELSRCLTDGTYDRIDLLVAFVMESGLRAIQEQIEVALGRGAHLRLLTTDYLAVTDVTALGFFLDRLGPQDSGGWLEARVFSDPSTSFHPKAYLFLSSHGNGGVAFVGSSNLSRSALQVGVEWNLETAHVDELAVEFDALWTDQRSTPLTREWLENYANRRQAIAGRRIEHVGELVADEDAAAEIAPWSVQQQALDALTATRLDGHQAGLVVMATGLGKTWLAAFDTARPGIRRVLFVAHREEILKRSRDVFRMVRPGGSLTLFVGGDQDASGDVVFASIQSLQRNLDRFSPDEFDYIVVDEFHHAAAPTYRQVIGHFTPRFMLGLTATPDRTDAADLLALCGDNLVFECGLLEGLQQGLLSPFAYRAIKDVADYENLPWRSGRFEIEELAQRLETVQRAEQVYAEWAALDGASRRAIGFCCSVTHADYMAAFFVGKGVRARSVHSGPTSADRFRALADLETADVEVIFSVDLFNEGIDVPALDIVLMLRPTESPIVFFQQLGRGLRRVDGKAHLDVIDLVGNHRGFLMKARVLAALAGHAHITDREAVDVLKQPIEDLPAGCSIIVETEAVDLLDQLVGAPTKGERLTELIRTWLVDHADERPTALELALAFGSTVDQGTKKAGWFALLDSLGLLTDSEQRVLAVAHQEFREIERGAYSKSYKLVTWLALAEMGALRAGVGLHELATACRWRIFKDPRLLNDLADATGQFGDVLNPTDSEWVAYWRRNPIAALAGEGKPFDVVDSRLVPTFDIRADLGATFDAMVIELVEYRLHRYLVGKEAKRPSTGRRPVKADGTTIDATFHVETSLGCPVSLLFESSGGTKKAGGRNLEYVAGVDVVLERLKQLKARVADAYVDSTVVRALPIAERRLLDEAGDREVDLSTEDVESLRRRILARMAKVGQAEGAKGGGNQRKAFRLVLAGLEHLDANDVARFLEVGEWVIEPATADDVEVS